MISQILESIFAQTAFDLERNGNSFRIKDHLALSILQHRGSKAVRHLQEMISESQLQAVIQHLKSNLEHKSGNRAGAAAFLRDYRKYLSLKHAEVGFVSTVDVVIDILEDSTTPLCEAFKLYVITEKEYYESSEYSHSTVFSDVGLG